MKITIVGDIMCEPPVLNHARQKDGSYNFDFVYEKTKKLFSEADYVIGNLEFPMAGEKAKYTDKYYEFNVPDSFATATKNAGINLVSTVNNHTLDRFDRGMIRTLEVLDKAGLDHTGTYYPEKGRDEAFYFDVGGVKFALIAYTYTTNESPQDKKIEPYINYLHSPDMPVYLPEIKKLMTNWVDKVFGFLNEDYRANIKKCLGMPNTIVRPDDNFEEDKILPYMEKYIKDIKLAKQKADFVICFPHVGGQFNFEPGRFSKYVFEETIKAGADAVFASHSHIIQKAGFIGEVPYAYCISNFNMATKSPLTIKERLPGFGLAMHLYFDGKKLERVTYSILKAVQKGKEIITWTVDELYTTLKTEKEKKELENEVKQIYKFATGNEITDEIIKREYSL